MSWDSLAGADVRHEPSDAESDRFGLTMARLTVGRAVAADDAAVGLEMTRLLVEVDADVVVVRYPAERLGLAAAVARSGRDVLAAGSLTYWAAPVGEVDPGQAGRGGDLTVRTLAELGAGAGLLDDLVADAFSSYRNHYAADPLLDARAALEGYQEWARSSAERSPDDVLVLLLAGLPVGMATLVDSQAPGEHVEVLLAGLRTSAQGRGLYGTLLATVAHAGQERGARRLVISTQTHNVRVQRAWVRAGLRPVAAVETLHAVRRGLVRSPEVPRLH